MRIAVASKGLEVSLHFERTLSFTCYQVDYGVFTACQNMTNPQISLPELVSLFSSLGVDALIANSIDIDARLAFERAGIDFYKTEHLSPREAAQSYLANILSGADRDFEVA